MADSDEYDELRTLVRRQAISDEWPTQLLVIVEDLTDTARENGTHALRSVRDQSVRLGIPERSVKRYRKQLADFGVLRVRRAGGNGRGAAVVDVTPRRADAVRAHSEHTASARVEGHE